MFEPSRGAGFIDIQDGDAISESSDTEVVAHTKEQVQYGNQASLSESNSDDDANDRPPPLNSDDEDDDGIDGPPPLDTDDNEGNTDDELPTSPDTGSREELNARRVPVPKERRHVKSSEESESDSDSDRGVKEVPPPLDSENEEENEASNYGAQHGGSATVETTEDHVHDSPLEDDDEEHDKEHDDDNMEHDNINNIDDDEEHDDDNDDNMEHDNIHNDDENEEHDGVEEDNDQHSAVEDDKDEDEDDNTQATPYSAEAVTHKVEDSDESEQYDSPAEAAERQIPIQHQSSEEEEEEESDNEAEVDAVAEAHMDSPVKAEISSTAILSDENSQGEEHNDDKETDVRKDSVSTELNEKDNTVFSGHDKTVSAGTEEVPDVESDQDSDESTEFVPDEDENELEWDVEDFDLPKRKSMSKTTSKVDKEGLEVNKLKKSFLDTLKSEAEQTKVIETGQKAESKKKEKPSKGLIANNTQVTEQRKQAKDSSKNVPIQQLKSVPGSARRATKDTPPKPEQVKAEKKSVKDGSKNVSKNLTTSKPVDSTTKPVKAKPKAADNSLEKTGKSKSEKPRKDVKENSVISEVQTSERKAAGKVAKAKSGSASSLPTDATEQQRVQTTLPTKERKKPRPSSDFVADLQSHKEETNSVAGQKRKETRRPRTSDSDAALDSLPRQKPQKTSSSESVSKQKKLNATVSTTHKEKRKANDNAEIKQSKPRRSASKSVASVASHEDDSNYENKRHSDIPVKNTVEGRSKAKGRPTSNGHFSSSQEKLLSHSGRHDHGAKDHDTHKHGGHAHDRGHTHDRSKHVWLCRDDEIHKLIAQKASLLKEYESGSLAGRKVCK